MAEAMAEAMAGAMGNTVTPRSLKDLRELYNLATVRRASQRTALSEFRKALRERVRKTSAYKTRAAARAAQRQNTALELAAYFTATGRPLTTEALRNWLETTYRSKKGTTNRMSYLPAIRAAIMKNNKEAFADYAAEVAAKRAAGREKAIAAIKKRAAERDLVTPWFWNYSRIKATDENKAYRDALKQQMIEFARRWRKSNKTEPIHGLFRILAGL